MPSKTNIKPQITARVFLKGIIKNISAMALSDGGDTFSDADIFRNHKMVPIIPGTSITGALKDYIQKQQFCEDQLFNYFFGCQDHLENNNDFSIQSHFIIDDLICTNKTISTFIRDGVKINPKSNLAEDQAKYNYEILEPEHNFEFNAELILREGITEVETNKFIAVINHIFQNGLIQVGALTSFGFGQLKSMRLERTDWLNGKKYLDALMTSPVWLDKFDSFAGPESGSHIAFFTLNLIPTTPLFIGGGIPQSSEADDASLKSNDDYILSAKSLKGSLRHHAYRIANTIHGDSVAKRICNKIFGNNEETEKLTKSNFWLSDSCIVDAGKTKPQTRVAIDRFTGAAMKSALFATEPVWPSADTHVEMIWKLTDCKKDNKSFIGLLLLVMRDLLTEFLAVGGDKSIGRGRFKGSAKIKISSSTYLFNPFEKTDNEVIEALDEYVNAFINYKD